MSNFCKNCGAQLKPETKFCASCGTKTQEAETSSVKTVRTISEDIVPEVTKSRILPKKLLFSAVAVVLVIALGVAILPRLGKEVDNTDGTILGQANLAIQGFTDNKGLDYEKYEKIVSEANSWYQYQQILLKIMYKIGDLTYALNLGVVSRENSYAMYLPYAKQAEGALEKLNAWHKGNRSKLEIDIDETRRKRQGVEGFFMNIPALFNDDLHYKAISKRTAAMISRQSDGSTAIKPADDTDLFQKDVRLVAKDGKLYYLPEKN